MASDVAALLAPHGARRKRMRTVASMPHRYVKPAPCRGNGSIVSENLRRAGITVHEPASAVEARGRAIMSHRYIARHHPRAKWLHRRNRRRLHFVGTAACICLLLRAN